MLSQGDFHRRDARRARPTGRTAKCRAFTCSPITLPALLIFVLTSLSISCGSKPTDPRTVIPADAIVYLETRSLGRVFDAIGGNPNFQKLAKTGVDASALEGVSLSVAVTGFETSEQPVSEENAVLNYQPLFVAVAETNAWSWQTKSFVENQLGEFVNEITPGEVELEVTPRTDGEFYTWMSDGQPRAYALQQGSLVFFSNDESAIERCLAVKRGEAESIAGSPKLSDADDLVFGYISPEGIGQISNLVGIILAKTSSEEADVQSFVATVLPAIFRNSVKELTWTSVRSESGVEDRVTIELDSESSIVFSETLIPATDPKDDELALFIPDSAQSATRYLLRDPQIAWRSVVLTAGKKTDATSGSLLVAFSGSVFEPYGIEDPEAFLSSVGSTLVTVKPGPDSEDAVVVARVRDAAKIRRSVAREVDFGRGAEQVSGADVWRSSDGEIAVAFVGDIMVSGDEESVLRCVEARRARGNVADSEMARQFSSSDAVSVTVANETDSVRKVVEMVSGLREGAEPVVLSSRTETRFNRNGIERRTNSDIGLIGWIIEQLARERIRNTGAPE